MVMLVTRVERKWEHIHHAMKIGQTRNTGLDDIILIHQSLPNSSVDNVQLNTKIGELEWSSPVFINAMTGGGGEKTFEINRDLAFAAKEMNIPMAVGSQMSAIKNPVQKKTYTIIREMNRDGFLMANIGSEATVDEAKRAIDMIEANALQIHLNTIQELTMPEGDRNFVYALKRIEEIAANVDIPVIVKEVGFGMSMETVSQLTSVGIQIVDVGGYGGTNFAKIENTRRERSLDFFNDWGIPTAVSIVEAKSQGDHINVIASGGIQYSLDIIKSLALGASAVGIAGRFLKILLEEGVEVLIQELREMKKELKIIMAALGAKTVKDLHHIPLIIKGDTHHWLNERGINTKIFSQRKMEK